MISVAAAGNLGKDSELYPPGVAERFRAKFSVGDPDECWEWQASRSRGYGQLSSTHGGTMYKAPRIAWALANGRVPESSEHVLHSCDNPPCVNPAHLSLGNPLVNAAQREARGRGNPGLVHGSKNGMAKLHERDIRVIRNAYDSGTSTTALVYYFNVDRALIRRIGLRINWRHVSDD